MTLHRLPSILVVLLLLAVAERAHWHRTDQAPADPALVAAALADCRRGKGAAAPEERAFASCMARHGYYSWDGV